MKSIKVGIFGLGRGMAFLDCLLMLNAEIVAICDRRKDALEKASQKLNGKAVMYEAFDEFIEHKMDCVVLTNNFHEHTSFAVRCLEKGIHVLSECTSNATMAEGVELVRAAEKSNAVYMLAENYPYMKFNLEMKRICDGGTLGKFLFGEGEYNHPVGPKDHEFLRTYQPYEKHWRNFLPRTYYITHSLAPLMRATGAFPVRVTAFPVFAPLGDEYASASYVGDAAAIVTCLNNDDSVFRVTGCAAFGAHGNSYRICGKKGQFENLRGMGEQVMLRYNEWDIPEGMNETNLYLPEWNDEAGELADKTGHGGGDFFVTRDFVRHIQQGTKPEMDVYFATTMASVAILAHRSLLEGGKPYSVPDFHKEDDRKLYENDRVTPFYGADESEPSVPCCSRPDYKPTDKQIEKYLDVIKP